jgi:hypothetical protein
MNWKDIAFQVAAAGAPMLGKILGDALPIPGGSALGEWAGRKVAEALGVSATPEAVSEAIEQGSQIAPTQLQNQLQAAETEATAKYNAMVEIAKAQAEVAKTQVEQVNETIRAEVATGDGRLGKWRAWHAWELTVECPFLMGTILWIVVTGNSVAINGLMNLSGLIMTYLGARFGVLGVHVWQGSNERQAAITGVPSSVAKEVVKAVKGR